VSRNAVILFSLLKLSFFSSFAGIYARRFSIEIEPMVRTWHIMKIKNIGKQHGINLKSIEESTCTQSERERENNAFLMRFEICVQFLCEDRMEMGRLWW
jgi:hypothetical protein